MRNLIFVLFVLVATSASALVSANQTTKEKCKELYQGWVFNLILESKCEIGGNAAHRLGIMVKSLCGDNLTEDNTDAFALEVITAFNQDIEQMGKERLCEIEVPRYKNMVDTLFGEGHSNGD